MKLLQAVDYSSPYAARGIFRRRESFRAMAGVMATVRALLGKQVIVRARETSRHTEVVEGRLSAVYPYGFLVTRVPKKASWSGDLLSRLKPEFFSFRDLVCQSATLEPAESAE